jgi:hypothetical protein
VFGVAGLQRGLLGELEGFDRGWWPAMIVLELDGEFAAAGVDQGAAAGPALVQPGVDTDDLPDWPLRGSVPGRSANRTPRLLRRCRSRAVL